MNAHSAFPHAKARKRKILGTTSMLSALLVVASLLMPVAAHAADTAGLTIQKSVSDTSVVPGQIFNWVVEVGCSVLQEECINANLVDIIPNQFQVGAAGTVGMTPPLVGAGLATVDVTGQTVTVDFQIPLSTPAGQVGLDNQIVTITIPVTVRNDLPYTPLPITVTNTATVNASNATSKTATADTTITVPLQVATVADKSFTPATVLGTPGSMTTVTIGGTNTSNSSVDSFVIQDPEIPAVGTGIFATTLSVASLGTVIWPAGADTARVSVWDSTLANWVVGPPVIAGNPLALPPVTPANIHGVRIAFTSVAPTMLTGQTASFGLNTVVRSGSGSGSRSNTSTSTVSVGGQTATDTESKSLTLQAASSSVQAGKTIAPDRLASIPYDAQDLTEATVTLTARNSGTVPLTSLTISEPSTPNDLTAANPLAPANPGDLTFQGFGTIVWPSGATAAGITYYYSNNTSSTGSTSTTNTLPSPLAGRVTGFKVRFTGPSMPANSQATLPFTVKTNPLQTQSRVEVLNQIAVEGLNTLGQTVSANAQDDAIVYGERLELTTQKSLTRGTLNAIPGQQTTAILTTSVSAYPASTREANQVIQYDPPASETGLTEWYRYFNPTGLASTSVPGGATLTVQYRDSGGAWADVPGLELITEVGSPHTLSIPSGIRDSIYGLRLVWNSPSGFVPGSTLASNLTYQLRTTLRDTAAPLPNANLPGTLINCSSATGRISNSGPDDAATNSPTPCPKVDLVAFNSGPGGGGIPLDKQFRTVGTNGTTVNAAQKDVTITRSSERTGVRLGWSTGGLTGVNTMTVTDAAVAAGSPTAAGYAKGMYDAFNLVRINPINSAIDPFLQFDRVAIQAFNLSTNMWETPAGITCTVAAPCGSFAGYTLLAPQQELYVGVRFIYSERPGRITLDQPAGAGVAASTGTTRGITLVYAIRDTLRSTSALPTPVPVVDGPLYNQSRNCTVDLSVCHSVLRNDVHAAAQLATETTSAVTNDTIELQDANLQLDTTKTWTGGDVPLTGIPAPSTRVTLRTTNQTSASTVNKLTILEPNPDTILTENPFNVFNLSHIQLITPPAGAMSVVIEVRNGAGTIIRTVSGTGPGNGAGSLNAARNTAYSWTALQLADGESVSIVYSGRMAVNQFAEVQLDLQRRVTERSSGNPVVAGTVDNGVKGSVSDLRFVQTSDPANPLFAPATLTDKDRKSISLVSSSIGVAAAKSFSPVSQSEEVRVPITMMLSGTPSGSQRVKELVLTDDRATFWNAFDFVAKGAISLQSFASPGGATQLQVEVCTGGAWDPAALALAPNAGCLARGGTWQGAGIWLTQAQLTAGSFLPGGVAAADVTGLRVTMKRSDGAQWENPQAPTVTINLSVQRRINLRTGGPVPSDYSGNTTAPGEPVLGSTTNRVLAEVTGIWNDTANDSTTANYRLVHQTTSVQVSKLPVGVRSPGVQIPYELTMLNTGQRPIENPVITDHFPTDGTGAMLIFNPDAPTNYTFTVSGGTVPAGSTPISNGTVSGTTPGVVTITPTTDAFGPTKIAFTFPVGTVIGVGQTVKVRIPLFLRPGLPHATVLNNVFDVTGDRLLDACTAPSGSAAPAVFVSSGRGCETSARITIAQSPALRAVIEVKALATPGIDFPGGDDSDSQFVGGTNVDCRNAQNTAGFSRPNCAPQTIPGQKSTWRLTVQNTGTTDISRLVVATRLPAPGDQTIVSNLVRDSAWRAAFNGTIVNQFGSGAIVQTFYTTRSEPCVAVLDKPSDVAACGTIPATGWAPLPVGDPGFDPSVVTGLQFVVDYPSGSRFSPGAIAFVDIGTTTVADLSVFSGGLVSDPLAVNSLSVSGISPTAPIPRISSLDYSRSLLSLATGSVTLTKNISGPAESAIPDGTAFNGSLVCTSLGKPFTRPFQFTVTGGVISPSSITFDNLPGGASCTVTETADSGQTTNSATTVIVDPLADPVALPGIELTNDYQFTQFEVRKKVTAALGTIIPTNFAFAASCTFLGQPIDLDPVGAGTNLVFDLDDGDTRVITGVPVNSDCIVTETNRRGADVTVVSGATLAPGSVTEDQANTRVTITGVRPQADPAGPNVNWMAFDNRFDAAAVIIVTKDFAGSAADQFGENAVTPKTFTIHAVCTFENVTQFDGDLLLTAANGWSDSIPDLIEGAECAFTEPNLNGADLVIFDPAVTVPIADPTTGFLVAPGINTVAAVTATNWFLTGAVEITKTWTGDGAGKFGQIAGLDYEFTLLCTRDGVEVDLSASGGNTRVVNVGNPTVSYTGIASGANCVLTENESNGAYAWRVLDNGGGVIAGGDFTVTVDTALRAGGDPVDDQTQSFAPLSVENTFRLASVSVSKSVDVHRPDGSSSGPFEVRLLCTLDGRAIDAAEPAVRPISEGQTITWTELAAGADCVITETQTGGSVATGYRIMGTSGVLGSRVEGLSTPMAALAPNPLTGLTSNHVEFVNSYPLASTGSSLDEKAVFCTALGGALLMIFGTFAVVWKRRRRIRYSPPSIL